MAGTRNHYERAFSTWLNSHGLAAMGVDERKRPVHEGRSLKNFDFLVNGHDRVFALDLKGRRESPWITQDDLFSLIAWRGLLRGAAEPALLFAFFAAGRQENRRMQELPALQHKLDSGLYWFALLSLDAAQRLARPRSARWRTYGFEWRSFCRAVVPVHSALLGCSAPDAAQTAKFAQS